MNFPLPGRTKDWIEKKAATGCYNTSSDFVRDLIRRNQAQRSRIVLMQTLLNEAQVSGESRRTMADLRVAALAITSRAVEW